MAMAGLTHLGIAEPPGPSAESPVAQLHSSKYRSPLVRECSGRT